MEITRNDFIVKMHRKWFYNKDALKRFSNKNAFEMIYNKNHFTFIVNVFCKWIYSEKVLEMIFL